MTAYANIPNLDDLLNRYVAGESENKLAREAGVSRPAFRLRLHKRGITPRSQSDAELAKWASMTAEQRAAQVAAAHEATKGRSVSWDELCRHAIGREQKRAYVVPTETELAAQLRKAGLDVTQQKAVGPYNIDVAVNSRHRRGDLRRKLALLRTTQTKIP